MAAGSWSLVETLFAQGDEKFVDELRKVHFAERLGTFAARWYADPRPFAKQTLLDYLSRPLNTYRHEPLVKRLFKLAENAGDDIVMGAFLVALDRGVRRMRKTIRRYRHESFSSMAAAEAAAKAWLAEGYEGSSVNNWSGRFYATATKYEDVVVVPGNTVMPRPRERDRARDQNINEYMRQRFEKRHLLFSLPTRRYLRRRAWRYFRKLGTTDPIRYLGAAVEYLCRYKDIDTDSDIHLLDCWGLVHTLFHHSPALISKTRGWVFAEGATIANLAPAPMFEAEWIANPDPVLALLRAPARVVRQWAVWMLRTHHMPWLSALPVEVVLALSDFEDPAISALGFDLLEQAQDLASVPVNAWLTRLDGDDLEKLQRLSELLVRRLSADRVSASEALRLANYRSKPVAELGLALVQQKTFVSDDVPALLTLVQAECEVVRPHIVKWLRATLEHFGEVQRDWILEFLDSKHADVRAEGWAWLNASPLKDEPTIWHRLLESPYEDIRNRLAASLDERIAGADPETVRMLWATVLVNIARGGRQKPGVVAKIVTRATNHPAESPQLLPLLAVAVRSLRGPEFRSGLVGVVRLAENKPDLLPAIRQRFPELEL